MPEGPVTLTLRPEELGTLQFRMTQTPDALHIHLAVDEIPTLDLLRRHADQLLADLRQAGFTGATLTFGTNTGGTGSGAGGTPQGASPDHSAYAPAAPQTAPPSRPATGTLDLRL